MSKQTDTSTVLTPPYEKAAIQRIDKSVNLQ